MLSCVLLLAAQMMCVQPKMCVGVTEAVGAKDEKRTSVVTAYSGEESPGINAKGRLPTVGRSVACPRALALGTKVIISKHEYVCDDRTAKRFDGRFDIFVGSKQEAFAWGKRRVRVTIIN